MRLRFTVVAALCLAVFGDVDIAGAQELWPSACPASFGAALARGAAIDTRGWPSDCFAECPRRAVTEQVDNPRVVADRCFTAINMRAPRNNETEAQTRFRDIDLNGTEERLEVRGIGNRIRQIYVFEPSAAGYQYLGLLEAHPSFLVARDENGELVLVNIYREGVEDVHLQYIQHVDGEFTVMREVRLQ